MLAYRVFPYLPSAVPGSNGSSSYLHRPQGGGRLDNPRKYDVWYLASDASGAVAEVFGDLDTWSDDMFDFPALPGSRRALGTYQIPDGSKILDLDQAYALHERGLRPTNVVERNRSATQSWALRVFEEADTNGDPLWSGIRWWSFHRPHWSVFGFWGLQPKCLAVEELTISHPAVIDAATSLNRIVVAP